MLAAMALNHLGKFETKKEAKAKIKEAVTAVSRVLGNTPSICRKCYVHPAVFESYLSGYAIEGLKKKTEEALESEAIDLRSGETAILKFLQGRLTAKAA